MKKLIDVEQKFLLLSLLVFIIIGTTIAVIINVGAHQVFIEERKNILTDLASRQAEIHLPEVVFTEPNFEEHKEYFKEFFHEIAIGNNVIRIKAYDQTGAVIYSDEEKLIGQRFFTNHELYQALGGLVVAQTKEADDDENTYEKGLGDVMEVYLPITKNNNIAGVVEIYYSLEEINQLIAKPLKYAIFTMIAILLFFYLTLFWFFKDASNQLKKYRQRELENTARISKLKDEFVFLAAHELRAPATIIKGYVDMIDHLKNNKKLPEYLGRIDEANERLLDLINDLLEIARSDAGKLKIDFEPVSLEEIIEKELKRHAPQAKRSLVKIEYKKGKNPTEVLANSLKVTEIITNLITNAIKYSRPKGGKITITHEFKNKNIVTHVTDNGVGLSLEDQKHIFEKFWRSNTAHKKPGTGLGLFITKELVERMHGSIWFSSTPEKGTTFSFSLPKI